MATTEYTVSDGEREHPITDPDRAEQLSRNGYRVTAQTRGGEK